MLKKKLTFTLPEVLICIALFALVGSFMMRTPFVIHKRSLEALVELEKQRIANVTLFEIEEKLLENHPWGSIPMRKEEASFFSLPEATIYLKGFKDRTFQRSYTLFGPEHAGKERRTIRKLHCDIYIDKTPFKYRLFTQTPKQYVEEKSFHTH